MRATRLLRILLLLQNRGRLTSAALARELEVTARTILRDVDALTEAGLPIIVHRGNQGGIELGFNYRTRLTGLAADEAEALGVMLSAPNPALDALGLTRAADLARAKLVESLPDTARAAVERARERFRFAPSPRAAPDPRVAALAEAVRRRRVVTIRARTSFPRAIHPVALTLSGEGWSVVDAKGGDATIALTECADLNVSACGFEV